LVGNRWLMSALPPNGPNSRQLDISALCQEQTTAGSNLAARRDGALTASRRLDRGEADLEAP